MFPKKPCMIPVNPLLSSKEPTDQFLGKEVTPMAAGEERVNAEMKEAIKENNSCIREDYKSQDPTTVKSQATLKPKTPQRQLKRNQESGNIIFDQDKK